MGWPLVLTSIVALALVAERTVFFWRTRPRGACVLEGIRRLSAREEAANGTRLTSDCGCPLVRMAAVYQGHLALPENDRRDLSLTVIQDWLSHARGPVKTLGMIAQVAPLLGLTGTVLGLVEAFRVIEASERAISPALLAGGIWEALLTTIFGMLISIPVIVFIRIFNGRLETVRREAINLYAWLEGERYAGHLGVPSVDGERR
ncbi:MAG: MotA/TolQ/ExbB proton channel family protein [Opitutales bacterium]|nr:MotA/TolQ/ExbB proton channel family protein [Opitutales bacterium]